MKHRLYLFIDLFHCAYFVLGASDKADAQVNWINNPLLDKHNKKMHNRILKHIRILLSTYCHLFKTLMECSLSSGN